MLAPGHAWGSQHLPTCRAHIGAVTPEGSQPSAARDAGWPLPVINTSQIKRNLDDSLKWMNVLQATWVTCEWSLCFSSFLPLSLYVALSQFHRSVLSARQWNKLRKYHGHKSHLVLQSIFILSQQCLMYHCIYLCPRAMKWRSDATEAALKRKMCDIPYSASGGFDTNPWLGQLWEFSWANWPRNWHQKLSRISRLIWASPASLWL